MEPVNTSPVIIIGAGPAGLTAGVELVRAGVPVRVLESDPEYVGGLARTVRFGPWRIDVGGHRFYTRNAEVMSWWQAMLSDDLLVVERQSRIYYKGKFFDYPLRAPDVMKKLGIADAAASIGTWLLRRVRPVRPERSFRDWIVNRFGDRLFSCFFESYTEKVWGLNCSQISADWAEQRIQGFSLQHAILNSLGLGRWNGNSPKTLIERFHYPRLGCGQMWERARDVIEQGGGVVELGWAVDRLIIEDRRVTQAIARGVDGSVRELPVQAAISSMPLRDLIRALDPPAPDDVRAAAERLAYRDFLTVALVVESADAFTDQWIYIHEPSVRVGRIQNFRNWSPAMVPDPGVSVLGLEYFCFEGDTMWTSTDEELIELAARELETIGLARREQVREGKVVRMAKAYPVYDHSYRDAVDIIRRWLMANVGNLWSAGRNAMHQYNNQDHSMAAALLAAANLTGRDDRDPWSINHAGEFSPRLTPQPLTPEAVR